MLGGTGARLWELLDPPLTVPELVARLASDYTADPATVLADVTTTLDEIERRGIARSLP